MSVRPSITPTLLMVNYPAAQSTADWCESNVYLSPRVPTSEPGQWKRRNVPAWAARGGPLEALDDPEVETVIAECGAQVAKTTTAYSWLAKEQATDPGSALVVMNSVIDAREKSDETWRPMFEDSHALHRYLPTCRRKDWTKLFQRINGAPVYWIGANSPGRLGAKPIRRLILDERDKYPRVFRPAEKGGGRGEAGATELARQRVKAFRKKGMAKIVEFSTPTDEAGIHAAFLAGDQRKLYVACPHCKADQVMVWTSFKIDMDLAKSDPGAAVSGAHYECPHCQQPWTDDDRWNAVAAGEWKPSAKPQDPKARSFQMPSWCSTFVTVSYLAAQWIQAQTSQSKLQDFINSECAEPFVHYDNSVRDSEFAKLEGAYNEQQLFAEIEPYAAQYIDTERAVIGGVDVQKGYLVATFRQFLRGGDSGLVWHGTVAGFDALDKLSERYGAAFVFVDRRYRTREVDEYAWRHATSDAGSLAAYVPCEGVKTRAKSIFQVSTLDLDEGRTTKTGQRVIEILAHDGDQLKDILATLIQRQDGAPRWFVPRGYSSNSEYCAQMTAERSVNGRWINPQGKANHAWDSEVLCLLGAIRLQLYGRF